MRAIEIGSAWIIWTRWGFVAALLPFLLTIGGNAAAKPFAPDRLDFAQPLPIIDTEDADAQRTARDLERLIEEREEAFEQAEKRHNRIVNFVCLLVGGLLLWPLGRWMNQLRTVEEIDPISGNKYYETAGGGHTLFFIAVQYWAIIWVLMSLFIYLVPMLQGK